ncbi:MAG: efflux transporter outer membrane subunit [Pseudomonadota bacterium]
MVQGIGRFAPLMMMCATMSLMACQTVGPEYTAPQFDLVSAYSPEIPMISPNIAGDGRWWQSSNDPVLQQLLQDGLANNLDLQIAASRIAEARAIARGVVGGNGVQADIQGNTGVERRWSTREAGNYVNSAEYGAALDLEWTPDLWGGQLREEQGAQADLMEQIYLREDVYRTVIADIVRNYIELRGTQQRQALLRDSLDLQRQTSDIVQLRAQSGLASELDLSRARAEVADIEATLPLLQTGIDRSVNALAVLIGAQPGTYRDELLQSAPLPLFDAAPAIGLPADLLRRRPDLRAAELALISATAEIGVQTAELYPQLSLNGSLSMAVSGFGTGPIIRTALAAIGAVIDANLYDGGQRRANVEVAEQRAQQAFYAYRQTLLNAIEEVESAIFGYVGAVGQRDSLITAVAYHRQAFDQSRVRYVQGLSNFLDVLDAQRTLTRSQQDLADAETSLELETINLYEAVGLSVDDVEQATGT